MTPDNTAPEQIWLIPDTIEGFDLDGAIWGLERASENDVEYIRADLCPTSGKREEALDWILPIVPKYIDVEIAQEIISRHLHRSGQKIDLNIECPEGPKLWIWIDFESGVGERYTGDEDTKERLRGNFSATWEVQGEA